MADPRVKQLAYDALALSLTGPIELKSPPRPLLGEDAVRRNLYRSPILQNFDDGQASMTAYEPTMRERLSAGAQSGLEFLGVRRPQARTVAQGVFGGESSPIPANLGIVDVVPFLGTALQTEEAVDSLGRARQLAGEGQYGQAAVETGMGILGLIPGAQATNRAADVVANRAVQAIMGDPNATARGVLEMAGDMAPLARITTYHGSPYLFRRFDPAKVGTGEGAQAYGVGAGYTAEARQVAEEYKNFVQADKGAGFPSFWARLKYAESGGDKEKAAASINENIAWLENNRDLVRGAQDVDESIKNYRDALKVLEDIKPNQGYLYKGEIPDEILPKFLDWDKPFSEQTKDVQKAYKEIAAEFKEAGDPRAVLMESNIKNDGTGSMMYQSFVNRDDIQDELKLKATKILQSKGLRGIRYLDEGSRDAGKGTSNFIPFSPKDYRIQEINDIPIEEFISQGML